LFYPARNDTIADKPAMTSVAMRSVFAIHDDENVRDWCNHQVAASIPTTFNSVADFETRL
jgi:hypothetical protein